MPEANYLPEVLETTEPECPATGFIITTSGDQAVSPDGTCLPEYH
jgi:hypothetical protein